MNHIKEDSLGRGYELSCHDRDCILIHTASRPAQHGEVLSYSGCAFVWRWGAAEPE
jgi:hypothetical protein